MNSEKFPNIKKELELSFFSGKAFEVAPDLLGKLLVLSSTNKTRSYYITEVEAYDGFKDRASHAYKGITERNKIMFGPAGYYYIYLCYGIHWMLNIVTGDTDYPSAILIRSVDKIQGPGRLTKALQINKEKFNGLPAINNSGLFFAEPEINYEKNTIKRSPRIGVDYAGLEWKNKKWRYFL